MHACCSTALTIVVEVPEVHVLLQHRAIVGRVSAVWLLHAHRLGGMRHPWVLDLRAEAGCSCPLDRCQDTSWQLPGLFTTIGHACHHNVVFIAKVGIRRQLYRA